MFSSITTKTVYRTWLNIWVTRRVSLKHGLLTIRIHLRMLFFFFGVHVTHLFCCGVVLFCAFTFCVPCCVVRYDFRSKLCSVHLNLQMFCIRVHVLFTLFVFVCVQWCPTHIVLCFCSVFSSCVSYVASYSGFSPFLLFLRYSLMFI